MQTDKLLHFSFSYMITLTVMLFIGWYGVIIGLLAGIGKEAYDQCRYKGWCWYDLLADLVGVLSSTVIYVLIG